MIEVTTYDTAIIGGGLAGLSAAIRLAGMGHQVVLIEKEKYPFHKVCGEYIGMESWNYLNQLGLDLKGMVLPKIDQLQLTAPNGNSFLSSLRPGGFGISRYLLDHALMEIAKKMGVHIMQETKADAIDFDGKFRVSYNNEGVQKECISKTCVGSFGKRSNIDIKWKRAFLDQQDKRLENFIGVKYHLQTSWPENRIGLHNFENGYCGISKIEGDKYCLCYLTTAANLKKEGNQIAQMEANILSRNPHLNSIFLNSKVEESFPVTISQVSFQSKTLVENHVLMAGDAGGMITPLCGNGMSIALHTGKIAADLTDVFLKGKITREEMELKYRQEWQRKFGIRFRSGRVLQAFFGSNEKSNGFVGFFKQFPFLAQPIIRLTHGRSF